MFIQENFQIRYLQRTMPQRSLYITTCTFARPLTRYFFPTLHTQHFCYAW